MKKKPIKMNFGIQTYIFNGIPVILQLIDRKYKGYKAKRFTLNGTNQNVWIPNKHLDEHGNIKQYENIDYIFRKAKRQLEISMQQKSPRHLNGGEK